MIIDLYPYYINILTRQKLLNNLNILVICLTTESFDPRLSTSPQNQYNTTLPTPYPHHPHDSHQALALWHCYSKIYKLIEEITNFKVICLNLNYIDVVLNAEFLSPRFVMDEQEHKDWLTGRPVVVTSPWFVMGEQTLRFLWYWNGNSRICLNIK